MPKDTTHLKVVSMGNKDKEILITKLEELLQSAKEDKVKAIYYVVIDDLGGWIPTWAGDTQSFLMSLGALEALKWELMRVADLGAK